MSGHGFHVHGPHDHEVEHAAHGGDSFSSQIAVITAVLATVGAVFGYEAGLTQNNAALYKNEAAIKKTEESDQWNFYQAKSNKQSLSELAMTIPGVDREKYKAEAERYKKEKADIMEKAKTLQKESEELNRKSDEQMHQHHRWAQAMTAEQIAISLAAITLLTRKKWLEYGAYGVAAVGVVLGVLAYLHI